MCTETSYFSMFSKHATLAWLYNLCNDMLIGALHMHPCMPLLFVAAHYKHCLELAMVDLNRIYPCMAATRTGCCLLHETLKKIAGMHILGIPSQLKHLPKLTTNFKGKFILVSVFRPLKYSLGALNMCYACYVRVCMYVCICTVQCMYEVNTTFKSKALHYRLW